MSKAESLSEEQFAALIESYRKKFQSLPADANQLREHALEEGQAVRYGQVRRHWDHFHANQQKEETAEAGADTNNGSEETEEKSLTWEDVWQDYLKAYSNSPKEPIHIFNHAKDMQWTVRYTQAKRAFKRLSKEFGEQEPPKPVPKPRHTKKHSLTEEAFQAMMDQYRAKYNYNPKDARMLFSFAVEDLDEHVRYGAVSRAFNRWFVPSHSPSASQSCFSLLSKPIVSEREGTAPPPGEIPGADNTITPSSSVPPGTDVEGATAGEESAGVVPAIIGAPDDKATHIPQEIFGQIIEKYKSLYHNDPQNAQQVTTFAADHGYYVRYGAVRRAWTRFHRS